MSSISHSPMEAEIVTCAFYYTMHVLTCMNPHGSTSVLSILLMPSGLFGVMSNIGLSSSLFTQEQQDVLTFCYRGGSHRGTVDSSQTKVITGRREGGVE